MAINKEIEVKKSFVAEAHFVHKISFSFLFFNEEEQRSDAIINVQFQDVKLELKLFDNSVYYN